MSLLVAFMSLKCRHFVNSQNAGKFVIEDMKNILTSEDIKNMFYAVGLPYNKMYDAMFIMDGELSSLQRFCRHIEFAMNIIFQSSPESSLTESSPVFTLFRVKTDLVDCSLVSTMSARDMPRLMCHLTT